MASTLQQSVALIQQNDYVTLAVLTAVGYDYILTISEEVEYIWNKPWTCVSTLYFLARYFGLCFAIIVSILGSSFLPGPPKVYVFIPYVMLTKKNSFFLDSCKIVLILTSWTTCIFIAAADLVMILRVWALYNRSRLILATFLPLYVTEVGISLAIPIQYSAQDGSLATTIQVLDFSFCAENLAPNYLPQVMNIFQLTIGALMCLFIAIRLIRESVQMHRATSRFKLGRYVNLLSREGMLYFLAIATFALFNFLFRTSVPIDVWWAVLEYVPVFTLVPRFTLSLRALYARDVQGEGKSDIDTAFGFTSAGHGAVPSAIMFADAGQSNESEGVEEMVVEVGEVRSDGDIA